MTTRVRWTRALVFAGGACATAALLLGSGIGPTPLAWIAAAVVVAAGLLAAFSPYDQPYPQPAPPEGDYALHTIQFDDFGTLWDVTQAQQVLDDIDATWQTGNTFVVVFVHGWHHNADPADHNLRDFDAKLLRRLHAQLTTKERCDLRERLTGTRRIRLVGLYLGWRGRSLPGALDYLSVWSRGAAARRVGDGDASEFVERLQRMYLRANATARGPVDGTNPFMGLVTLGHSFGGQVLLRAVARPLEFELAERTQRQSDVLKPPRLQADTLERAAIDDFGDVNILLNPALEAGQFARIDDLRRQLRYPATQPPQLVVFSADDDFARRTLFPASRLATLPFRPPLRSPYQGRLYGQALGALEAQRTHDMDKADGPPSLVDADYLVDGGAKVREFDFSGEVRFGRVRMHGPPALGDAIPNCPVSVVVTHQELIRRHNGIFGDDFVEFLCAYMGFVSGKRLMIHHERRAARP